MPIDACPKWAEELILKIRAMEVQLGNVRPGMGKKGGDDWKSQDLGKLMARLTAEDGDDLKAVEAAAEALFAKIAKGLSEEGFTPEEIAQFVNARVAPESRLPYCDTREVMEALGVH